MKYTSEIRSNTVIISLSGDLIGENDGTGILSLATEAINQHITNCIINIADLRYINSSGIGVLITILTKFRNKGGEVYLLNPSESVKKLLVITKLNAIFQVIRNPEEVIG
ncbi:MAG: STAS domain-containing protein [Cyclobacteriaceae bacterium]|jgi:anti-sigma B factor antagonist|nr:STAS domain-containing protein [Cyclobacteriaceae bacterium]